MRATPTPPSNHPGVLSVPANTAAAPPGATRFKVAEAASATYTFSLIAATPAALPTWALDVDTTHAQGGSEASPVALQRAGVLQGSTAAGVPPGQ
jgi:hypothetical protein